jgi:chromosome segregation ATPase
VLGLCFLMGAAGNSTPNNTNNNEISSLLHDLADSSNKDLDVEAEFESLRLEIRSLNNELRSVKVDLASCAESRSTTRMAENDHVTLHWVQGRRESNNLSSVLIFNF